MKKGFLAVVALLSLQSAIAQDQPTVQAKQNRLKRMTDFIVRNKACLSGTECSPRFSLVLNFTLGTAVGLAVGIPGFKAIKAASKKGMVASTAVGGTIGLVLGLIRDMGYEKLVGDISTPGRGAFPILNPKDLRCILRGDNCSLDQRRYLFLYAGSIGGIAGGFALQQLKSWYPNLFRITPTSPPAPAPSVHVLE